MSRSKFWLTKKACYIGYVIQAVVCNLLPLLFVVFNAEPYNISLEKLGRLILVNFTAQLIIDFLAIYIVQIFGVKPSVVFAQGCAAFGFVLLGVLPRIMDPYIAITVSVIFLATGSGLIEVLISPIVEALPSDNKAGSMSFLHSFFSWGQAITVIVTTLLLLLIGRNNWFYIPLIWAVLPAINTLLFAKSPIIDPGSGGGFKGGLKLLKNRRFYLFLFLMLAAGASEISMSQWASFFVEIGFNVPKWIGDLLGPCMFAILMGLGRTLYGLFGKNIPIMKALLSLSALSVICYLLVALSNSPILSVLGCAFCGFSVSLMWPGVLSVSAENFKQGGTAMFSLLAMLGDFGCSIGPWILGLIAEITTENGIALQYKIALNLTGNEPGMQLGFLITGIFPLSMFLILAYFVIKAEKCRNIK